MLMDVRWFTNEPETPKIETPIAQLLCNKSELHYMTKSLRTPAHQTDTVCAF